MNRTQESQLATWSKTVLPVALTIMFGQQLLRALLPYLQYLLGDRLGWSSVQLGLAGLLVFSTAFLTAWFNRRLGLRRMVWLSAGGLGLARLAAQLWSGDPLGDMILVIMGVILYLLFWPTYLTLTRQPNDNAQATPLFAQAVLWGLILDTALHGVFLTYDFIWQAGAGPLLLTLGLVLVQWVTLRFSSLITSPHAAPAEGSFLTTLLWLAIGPFLFLQLIVFQNQARLATLTNWSLPLAIGWVLISHILGLILATVWQSNRSGTIMAGLFLTLALWPWRTTHAFVFALTLLVGQTSAAILFTTIWQGLRQNTAREGLRNTTLIYGLSMILMVTLIFAFYVGFSLRVPYQNDWLLPVAGVVIALSGFGAAALTSRLTRWQRPWPVALTLPFLLLLLPLLTLFTWRTPTPSTSSSLRVMDYNVHNGFDANGHLGLEALAQVIETQQADLVTLQEVSRGWAVNGSADMLSWLSQRLGFLYYDYAPSGDALIGQAVLSRYPILRAETYPLPPRDLPIKRSFTYLQIDTGQTTPLNLLNTHFQNRPDDSPIRLRQAQTILDFLVDRQVDQLILTGDLNAQPDAAEIQLFYEHGLNDVVIEANLVPGYTFYSKQPSIRLDYVLISPNLTATDVVIPRSTASDHLGIAATINLSK